MRKLYLFVNNKSAMRDWLDCLSMTDDGTILGNHICSHMNYMIHDLHDRTDRLEKIKNHFKDEPYEIELLTYDDCESHEGFQQALKLSNEKDQQIEKAGATITYSNGEQNENI